MADQAVGASSRRWLEVFGKSVPRIAYNDQQLDTSFKCQVSDVAFWRRERVGRKVYFRIFVNTRLPSIFPFLAGFTFFEAITSFPIVFKSEPETMLSVSTQDCRPESGGVDCYMEELCCWMPPESGAVQGMIRPRDTELWPIGITILIGEPHDSEVTNRTFHW